MRQQRRSFHGLRRVLSRAKDDIVSYRIGKRIHHRADSAARASLCTRMLLMPTEAGLEKLSRVLGPAACPVSSAPCE